jgi:hypothetical protein
MKNQRPISTMKVWSGVELGTSGVLESPEIDLRAIAQNGTFSFQYQVVGTGRILVEHFSAPIHGGTYVEGSSDVIEITGDGDLFGTLTRACSSNIATVAVDAVHGAVPGQYVRLSDMGDSEYNGIHKILTVPSSTSLTFALTHADETEVADTGGELLAVLQFGSISFAPVSAAPWLKITVTEQGDGPINWFSGWVCIQ